MSTPIRKTDAEWRSLLNDMEFFVLCQAGTERPGSGALLHEDRRGVYRCRACDAPLFTSAAKFDSHCGWPSFFDPNEKDAVTYHDDDTLGHRRVEVRCATCDSHLGHVFPDAPHTPTGLRYCMNSVALSFTPDDASA